MRKVKYYAHETREFAELLRRYVCFHKKEDMYNINLWGCDYYGIINKLKKNNLIICNSPKKYIFNWYKPTKKIIDEVIKPAYELFLKDTGRHGHDLHIMNYISYISEVIGDNKYIAI